MKKMYSDNFKIGEVMFLINQVGKKEYTINVKYCQVTLFKVNGIEEVYKWCINYYNRYTKEMTTVG